MKQQKNDREDFLKAELVGLEEFKLIVNLEILEKPSKIAAHRKCLASAFVNVSIANQDIRLEIGLDADFPHSLPLIFVTSADYYGEIPHIETNGCICYVPKENLILNHKYPTQILEEAIQRAVGILEQGLNKENQADFIDEFDAYWCIFPNPTLINAYVTLTPTLRTINVFFPKDTNNNQILPFVADDDNIVKNYWHANSRVTSRNGLYIPLSSIADFALFQKRTLTVANLRQAILPNLSPRNKKILKRATKKWNTEEVVMFMLPRPSGGQVLFGVLFRGIHKAHPLDEKGQADEIIPLVVMRHDQSYILPRGGANELLQNKKVALIGCGAVGGNIAIALIQSGVLDITLLDNDIFKPENIFRQVLGKKDENLKKADALKLELESRFPYVRIKSFTVTLQDAVSQAIFCPEKYDLIILATGDDNSSLFFNQLTYSSNKWPPIIYSWLEPYGIGGHVLVTNNENRQGCFECLFTSPISVTHEEFEDRSSFVEPGQSFSKSIAGCSNLFMPYSALDANTTATFTVRIALKILLREIAGNLLFSWKGDDKDLVSAGFATSSRYKNSNATDLAKGVAVYTNSCKVCGDGYIT